MTGKITELDTTITPVDTDLVEIVQDVATTPVNKKITWASIKTSLASIFIPNSLVDAKGDLIAASADNTPARLAVGTDGQKLISDSGQTNGLLWKTEDGWNSAFETWEYVSVDDPTGIFRVNADVTGKYSAGMRIIFTNGGNIIYGIITVVSAYEAVDAGYTHITFLHQIDPTDSLALYLMANSAITLNYYSTQKAPQGFPLEPTKWTREFNSTTNTENALTQNVWLNIVGSLSIPIGSWILEYALRASYAYKSGTSSNFKITLSTANNSESDPDFTTELSNEGPTTYATFSVSGSPYRRKTINLTAKTIYYLNFATTITGISAANGSRTIIRAICAYL
jgi:hypothetical protein